MIPYLGEGLKSTKTLSFASLVDQDQKELIVVFKRQSAAQGIHLMTIHLSTNQDCQKGRHFTLGCHRHRVYQPKGNSFFKATTASCTMLKSS
jgi:hypothetical protein